MRIFVNGCFDILHAGHFNLLSFARQVATPTGEVIVAIDSDDRILEKKGRLPIFDKVERRLALELLRGSDGKPLITKTYWFESDDELYDIIRVTRPFNMVKGDDWKGKPIIGEDICNVIYYPVNITKIHSTTIINRIVARYGNKTVQDSSQARGKDQ